MSGDDRDDDIVIPTPEEVDQLDSRSRRSRRTTRGPRGDEGEQTPPSKRRGFLRRLRPEVGAARETRPKSTPAAGRRGRHEAIPDPEPIVETDAPDQADVSIDPPTATESGAGAESVEAPARAEEAAYPGLDGILTGELGEEAPEVRETADQGGVASWTFDEEPPAVGETEAADLGEVGVDAETTSEGAATHRVARAEPKPLRRVRLPPRDGG